MSKQIQVRSSTLQHIGQTKMNTSLLSSNSRSNSTKGLGPKQTSSSRNTTITSPMSKNRNRTVNKQGVSPKAVGGTSSSRNEMTSSLNKASKNLEKELYEA